MAIENFHKWSIMVEKGRRINGQKANEWGDFFFFFFIRFFYLCFKVFLFNFNYLTKEILGFSMAMLAKERKKKINIQKNYLKWRLFSTWEFY